MYDDSRDPLEPQVFGPCHSPLVRDPGGPAEAARAPPRPSGADQAARALVAWMPLVRSELRRRGVPEREVPDLVQNVLLAVLPWWTEQWLSPEPRAAAELAPYLRVAARHAARRDHRRRSKRRERLGCEADPLLALDVPDPAPPPDEALLDARATRERADFFNPQSLGEILGQPLWYIFREWAVLEIPVKWLAEGHLVPQATIYNRIRIARDKLRAELRRRRAALRSE